MMVHKKALVLFSGGQDSTACLLLAQKLFKQVHALSFDYGQKHDLSGEQLKKLALKLGATSYQIASISNYPEWTTSALFQKSAEDAPPSHAHLPSTFVPGRNLLFINIAAIHAHQQKLDALILGVSQVDYSGYPDCRKDFIDAAMLAVQRALDTKIEIFAPLIEMNKAEIWALIDELSDIRSIDAATKTCYNTSPKKPACQICAACQLRISGLKEFYRDPEKARMRAQHSLEKACIALRLKIFER